ncbi:U-box domain-containing protein 28-like [Magnolia sinica]|uniref:U-box domain-containing protein 28-like n=1 Tax=Magnolia sinica TaxID=86752 RepID=UPI00265B3817|nr:U-box domain-containing protein 28-like [Magnolia sinica]
MVKNNLIVTVPSFFKCPISLDVMKSPVSLCTGVTYDRASIQTWLDNGNNTCPATMQPLQTKDLIPNSTLQRLILSWKSHPHQLALKLLANLRQISPSKTPTTVIVDSLYQISDFLLRSEKEDRQFLINAGCAKAVLGLISDRLEEAEAVVSVLCLILSENRDALKSLDLNRLPAMLVLVLEKGSLESRIDSARVLEALVLVDDDESTGSFRSVAEKEGVLAELFRLMSSEADPRGVDAGLACLIAVAARRKMRSQIVQLGIIPVLAKLLLGPSDSAVVEKALKMLERASTCADGRMAICSDPDCIQAVVQRMLKVSSAGTERAVVVLWSLCHLFRDQKAQDAVIQTNGLTKILLLMQSDCSPSVRQMARDLVKIFRVNSKSCLSGYDTKTTHIMPF